MMNTAGIEETKADTSMNSASKTTETPKEKGTAQKESMTQRDRESLAAQDEASRAADEHTLLSWTGCYDDQCWIHKSEKDGSGWYPKKPKAKKRKSTQPKETNTAEGSRKSLNMMNSGQEIEWEEVTEEDWESEIEISENETDEEDSDLPEANDPGPVNFAVVDVTETYVSIVTNCWRLVDCMRECDQDSQHSHPVFDLRLTPKEYVRRITLTYCRDPRCYKELHVHQLGDDVVEMIGLRAITEQNQIKGVVCKASKNGVEMAMRGLTISMASLKVSA